MLQRYSFLLHHDRKPLGYFMNGRNRKPEEKRWCLMLYFDLRPSPKILFQGDTPEGSDTFQWPVIERDRLGGLRLMIWDKVKVPLCHYSDAPEESNL